MGKSLTAEMSKENEMFYKELNYTLEELSAGLITTKMAMEQITMLIQAITDPENQPNQFGVETSKSSRDDKDSNYGFDYGLDIEYNLRKYLQEQMGSIRETPSNNEIEIL